MLSFRQLSITALRTGLLTGAAALALTACSPADKPAAKPASTPDSPASLADAPMQAPSCDLTSATCSAPASAPQQHEGTATHFKASGFSPAWEAEVDGDKLSLLMPDFGGPDFQPRSLKVERSALAQDGADYKGQDGNTTVVLSITPGPCNRATEGGQPREFHVTVQYGQSTYHGCADTVR